ncbi:hypothetical protein U1Q18_000996, partial [Sarracenia purpurea var. burkii]
MNRRRRWFWLCPARKRERERERERKRSYCSKGDKEGYRLKQARAVHGAVDEPSGGGVDARRRHGWSLVMVTGGAAGWGVPWTEVGSWVARQRCEVLRTPLM